MRQVLNATKPFVLLLTSVALIITSCQKEELQGNSQAQNLLNSSQKQNQPKEVPFKAEFQFTSEKTQEDGALIIFTTGTGEGTHIGRSSYVCHARVDATGYNDILVMTATDGSEIHAVGKGPGPVIDFTTGDFLITYQSTITGGTGRLTGAAGSFTVVGRGNLNSPAGTGSLEGTISY
jgi:hypothetical protein